MSKSLGNSPDPIELIEKFGADGVRMGMMLSAPAGNDILFDEALCEQGRNFNNKIWNAFRLVKGWKVADDTFLDEPSGKAERNIKDETLKANEIATKWFEAKLRQTNAEVEDLFKKYRISEALMAVYKLFWDEFSSWYLEMVKPAYINGEPQPIDQQTYDKTLEFFEILLKMLHPFMPFITEELWQALYDRQPGESIMRAELHLPAATDADRKLVADFDEASQIVAAVRNIRTQRNIAPRQPLTLNVLGASTGKQPLTQNALGGSHAENLPFAQAITKMANLEAIETVAEKAPASASFLIGTTEFAVPLGSLIDVEAERKKLQGELERLESFLQSIQKKLANERFVQNAPAAVVEMERKKLSDAEQKIASLREAIASL